MHERQRWGRSQYAALVAVLALHVAVLTGLMMAAMTRLPRAPAPSPIEILILPQNAAPTVQPPPALSGRRQRVAATPLAHPPDALTVVPLNSSSDVAALPIDWAQEAHNAAANIAKDNPPLNDSNASPSSNS